MRSFGSGDGQLLGQTEVAELEINDWRENQVRDERTDRALARALGMMGIGFGLIGFAVAAATRAGGVGAGQENGAARVAGDDHAQPQRFEDQQS